MPKVTVAHNPQLTKDQAQELFARHFAGTYTVHPFKGPFRDFVVQKSAFVGVAVKLDQSEKETKFVFNGMSPAWWARATMGALLGLFIWKGITNEVEQYIRTAPELNGTPVAPPMPAAPVS
jgi:hypothetical protein